MTYNRKLWEKNLKKNSAAGNLSTKEISFGRKRKLLVLIYFLNFSLSIILLFWAYTFFFFILFSYVFIIALLYFEQYLKWFTFYPHLKRQGKIPIATSLYGNHFYYEGRRFIQIRKSSCRPQLFYQFPKPYYLKTKSNFRNAIASGTPWYSCGASASRTLL